MATDAAIKLSNCSLKSCVSSLLEGFEYWVDGEVMGRGKIPVPEGGFASLAPDPAKSPWAGGEKNAPFDQEVGDKQPILGFAAETFH